MAETELYIDAYREIAKIPEVHGAQIANIEPMGGEPIISVEVDWRCRDMTQLRYQHSKGHYAIKGDHVTSLPASLVAPNVVLQSLSPSGNFTSQIVQDDNEMVLIILNSNGCVQSIDLKAKNVHGKVYCDPYISCLEWSSDEKRIAFVAELKRPEGTSYFAEKKGQTESRGEKYLFRDDWGEQMIGQHQGTIVTADISSGELTIIPLPDELTPGELVWVPNTYDIVGVANISKPFKIGLAYCSDRESFLFCVNHDGHFEELTKRGEHVKCPRFDLLGEKMIYQKSTTFGERAPTAQLFMMTWSSKKEELIVDYVRSSVEISNGIFRGLCGKSVFPRRCFDGSDRRVILSAFNLASYQIYIIDLETKLISTISHSGSCIVQDLVDNWLLLTKTSLTEPAILYLTRLPDPDKENDIKYLPITSKFVLEEIDCDWLDLWTIRSPTKDISGIDLDLTALYFGPKKLSPGCKKRPLICWPHGGPHQLSKNIYSPVFSFFVLLGYSIILPNYRGSLGHGNDFLTSSLGQCGVADVEDCSLCIEQCLKRFPDVVDSMKLHLIGMSHGGFLVAHLISAFPEMFCSAAILNPALDVYIMAAESDIPEWAFLEYGLPYSIGRSFDKKSVTTMFERSPVYAVDKVKTPTLICLGDRDVRVPPSQGLNYYRMLLARNVPTKVFMYDDDHPLLKIDAESDYVIQIAKWFSIYNSVPAS